MEHWQPNWSINVYLDCVVLTNENTTLGLAHFSKIDRALTYIFVHPSYRRRGIGRSLVEKAEELCGTKLVPTEPISPIGQKFFQALQSDVSGPNCGANILERRSVSQAISGKRLDYP